MQTEARLIDQHAALNDFRIQVQDKFGVPLMHTEIGHKIYVEAAEGQAFQIKTACINLAKYDDNISSYAMVDGISTGFSLNLNTSDGVHRKISSEIGTHELLFTAPELIPMVDEKESKLNVLRNQNTQVGTIKITFWTRKKKSERELSLENATLERKSLLAPSAAAASSASSLKKRNPAYETKKFFDRPNIGVKAGMLLAQKSSSSSSASSSSSSVSLYKRSVKLCEITIYVQTKLVIHLLKSNAHVERGVVAEEEEEREESKDDKDDEEEVELLATQPVERKVIASIDLTSELHASSSSYSSSSTSSVSSSAKKRKVKEESGGEGGIGSSLRKRNRGSLSGVTIDLTLD